MSNLITVRSEHTHTSCTYKLYKVKYKKFQDQFETTKTVKLRTLKSHF